jgi:hypothetical protein
MEHSTVLVGPFSRFVGILYRDDLSTTESPQLRTQELYSVVRCCEARKEELRRRIAWFESPEFLVMRVPRSGD